MIFLICIAIWIAAVVLGTAVMVAVACKRVWVALRDSWRRAHAVIEQTEAEGRELPEEPVPYWPAEAGTEDLEALVTATSCGRCRPLGYGLCWCNPVCGHPLCWGPQTLRWLPEDDDIIEGRRSL